MKRKWVKWIAVVGGIPVALLLLLSLLLYLPPLQNLAIKQATRLASEATGMQIGIKQIHLSFPLDLSLVGVEAIYPPADTLLWVEQLDVRIALLSLLHQEVEVEAIHLKGVTAHTGSLIPGVEIDGELGALIIQADRVSLKEQRARLSNVELADTELTLRLTDSTAVEDTTPSATIPWKLELDEIALNRFAFALQLPDDSIRLAAYVERARLYQGVADLEEMRYAARHFTLSGSRLNYDQGDGAPTSGLDFSHIALDSLSVEIDSIHYHETQMGGWIKGLVARERSGLAISSLAGHLHSDRESISLPGLALKTPTSTLDIQAYVPWSTLDSLPEGRLKADLTARLSKADLLALAGALPQPMANALPEQPLIVAASVEGNLSELSLREVRAEMSGILRAEASGHVLAVTDSLNRAGEVDFRFLGDNLDFLLDLLPEEQQARFYIPRGMMLTGGANLAQGQYSAHLSLSEGEGKVTLEGHFSPDRMAYGVELVVDSVKPIHFMPHDSLLLFSATFRAEGQGLDPFLPTTRSRVEAMVKEMHYGKSIQIPHLALNGSLEQQRLNLDLASKYPLALLNLSLDGHLKKEKTEAILTLDVAHLDLHQLGLMADTLSTSFQVFAELTSDIKEEHALDLSVGNIQLLTPQDTFSPKMLTLKARTAVDTTLFSLHTGDLGIFLTGREAILPLMDRLQKCSDELALQLERDSTVNLALLTPLLPEVNLLVGAGTDNLISRMLDDYAFTFRTLNLEAGSSPEVGFYLNGALAGLMRDTLMIDTVRLNAWQDSSVLMYQAEVIKPKYRKQEPFTAGVKGKLTYQMVDAFLYMKDGAGKVGLSLGVVARKMGEGLRFHLFPENPILSFQTFSLNKDNYLLWRSGKSIAANLRLKGPKNATIRLHSDDEDDKDEEVTLAFNQVDLGALSKGIEAYLPPLSGMLNADVKYATLDSSFIVAADIHVDSFHYDGSRVGDLQFNATYLPLEAGSHQVDGHLFHDQKEVMVATALYRTGTTDHVTGSAELLSVPLIMVNPFIPDDMVELSGALNGHLTVAGTTDLPRIDGSVKLDTATLFVGALESSFRLDNKPVKIKESLLQFDAFSIFSSGKNPFVIDGAVNFRDLDRMTADLRLHANEMQVFNVKRKEGNLVYGRMDVNLNTTIKGPLDALLVRGDIQLLGTTNATYVLKESPLTEQDRMSDMVTFVSFADTVEYKATPKPPLPLGGMDVLLTIRIDPSVQLNADLTPDGSNHVYLEGGGDLSFHYTPQGDMILNGRYTLSGGKVKYLLPIIPLKEFDIRNGSFVQWNGNPMDPTLGLTATERVRTTVTLDGQSPRVVNFDVGIMLKQRLENLGMQFIISAPEDAGVEEQLARMGAEEQQKQAVALIVTGMYMGTGGAKVNVDAALNSFLQHEINSIAGSALKTIDITFGMDTYGGNTDKGEGARTDYSFSFAKRFYNDRLRIVIGGRISTGADVNQGSTAQSFIDKISIEYQLDPAGSRYVKMFYDKKYKSLLEGEITETGVGIALRRKMLHFKELFHFKKKRVKPVNEEAKHEPTN